MVKQTIPRLPRREAVPLSFAQQRLWFLDQLEPNGCVYNTPRAWRLAGALNVRAMRYVLNAIVARHEVLRTNYPLQGESPVQMIHESRPVDLPLVDLSQSGNSEREAELARLVRDEARRPFDLARDPMLRARLFRLGQGDHVLLCTMHHIATDGWSLAVFYQELATFYNSYCGHSRASLPELPIQYSDYAVWQRQHLRGEVLERQLVYWKERLQDAPGLLNLPTDRPRPPVQFYNGARRSVRLAHSLIEGLKTLSQRQRATLFMTMLAAWQTLLYRYTNQSDIVVGVPTAGRKHLETEKLIGFFVNTLALRTDLSGDPTFSELLARVNKTALEAFEHDELPFEKLVEELQPERHLSYSPLFQVMFAFQNLPQNSERMHGIEVRHCEVDAKIAKFDLTLSIRRSGEGQLATMEYNTDLFDGATIERMLRHYQTLLEGLVTNPEARISDLPMLTGAERQQLLVEWNDTQNASPRDKCIHLMFEAQVERTPDRIALVFEDRQLTYRELNNRANQVAHYLQKLTVGPEILVGLCLDRSIEMIVGLLAILKAGGAYVPLDPSYPRERLEYMLKDSRAALLLTQSGQLDSPIQRVCLDQAKHLIARESAVNLESRTTPNNLAYALYTSGSTGQPKGVAIEHRNAVAFLSWVHSAFTNEDLSGVLASTSICFDLSVFELFAPLTCGGTVILTENALALAAMPRTVAVSLINTVPSAMSELLNLTAVPSSVRAINLAGEPLRPELVRRIHESTAVSKVHDLYGPSECTTYSTWTRRAPNGRQTVGRPIANTQIYILDGHRNPVPIGVLGELYIGGDGVARGYLNRPELTEERFVYHSFDGEPAQRLYKTGDLARYLADGNIELIGRNDNQVKIRGYRIELGEIESVLMQHPGVQECAVIALEDGGSASDNRKSRIANPKSLIAYVVRHKAALAASELRDYLKTKLPDYMVPRAYVFLDALPLTPNGKVDRRALPEPDYDQRELTETFVAPRNSVEETIAAVWREILGKSEVGVHDKFFDLGGHSLKATQVVSRLRKLFQSQISLRHMFEYPTIAGLAAVIGQQQENEKDMNQLLSEIETLTEEQVHLLLAKG